MGANADVVADRSNIEAVSDRRMFVEYCIVLVDGFVAVGVYLLFISAVPRSVGASMSVREVWREQKIEDPLEVPRGRQKSPSDSQKILITYHTIFLKLLHSSI